MLLEIGLFFEAMMDAFSAIAMGFKFLLTAPVLNVFFILILLSFAIRIIVKAIRHRR